VSPYLQRPCEPIEQAMDRLIREAKEFAEAGLFNLAIQRLIDVSHLDNFIRSRRPAS
jgi:hypothetical protein